MHTLHPEAREAMTAIATVIASVVKDHESKQRLWMPSELIPNQHQFPKLPPEIAGLLTLNSLTEDGLPFFLSLLVKHLGDEGAIWDWNRLWSAEEDRHGRVIGLYLYSTLSRETLIDIERMQYAYMRSGFWPNWSNDPFQLIAYVVLQEQATWLSHAGIARRAVDVDPVLVSILSKVAGEEHKHYQAYLAMFEALLAHNPSHAIKSLFLSVKGFDMPEKVFLVLVSSLNCNSNSESLGRLIFISSCPNSGTHST